MERMKYPFDASQIEIEASPDAFISVVFSSLESEFLVLPKGDGFIDYPAFEQAYEVLKRTTEGFRSLDPEAVLSVALHTPLVLIVLRTILGFTPPEWAYVATTHAKVTVPQGFARTLDRQVRMSPPDFVIPDKFNPQVVIEAKITEDDGTARDKVTRVQHLASLSRETETVRGRGFEVVACIGGRGFAVRREDMKKLLLATRGKVFTLRALDRLVEHTRLREFRTIAESL